MVTQVIVFGSTGMLGRYVCEYLKESISVIGITRDDFDAETGTLQDLRRLFERNKVDSDTVVFNALGAIPHAGVQSESTYFKVNSICPMLLSTLCVDYGAKMIHATTDCVFDGLSGNYDEMSSKNSKDVYGLSKLIGENITATVIRTSIIGENKKGISLVEWVKKNSGKQVTGYTNHFWNGITCLQFAKLVKYMIINNVFWDGIRHIYSPEVISKADLIEMINKEYDLNITVVKAKVNLCDRSLKSTYDLITTIPSLQQQIHEMKEFTLDKL